MFHISHRNFTILLAAFLSLKYWNCRFLYTLPGSALIQCSFRKYKTKLRLINKVIVATSSHQSWRNKEYHDNALRGDRLTKCVGSVTSGARERRHYTDYELHLMKYCVVNANNAMLWVNLKKLRINFHHCGVIGSDLEGFHCKFLYKKYTMVFVSF